MDYVVLIKELIANSDYDESVKSKLTNVINELVADSDWLYCLQAAGVDNWSGIEEAYAIRDEESEE